MIKFVSPDFEKKICSPNNILEFIKNYNAPLVFTNGCFDILHRGHVTYLSQAKSLGESLIVAINSDNSIKKLKTDNRPINKLEDRLCIIAALESVDIVTWFDENTPINLIELIKPNILVKGSDWSCDNIVGAEQTLARKGEVISIPIVYDISTTFIIEKIKNAYFKE